MHTVLITGGNRGIGLAAAHAFHKQNDQVVITYRSGDPPAEFAAIRCDVTRPEDVDGLLPQVERAAGPVDVLVANAGITQDGLFARLGEEEFDAVLQTNLMGTIRVVRTVLRGMIRRRHGRIVLVSSASALSGSPGQTNYAAAKAGLIGFGRSLARELGPRGITVNIVAPGWIDTDMTRVLPDKARDAAARAVPLGRFGQAEEVASTVVHLAGDQASYITGAVIPVDGGIGMGH